MFRVSFGVDACVSGVRPRNVKHTAIASLTSCGSFFIFQPEHRLVIEHRSTHLYLCCVPLVKASSDDE